MFRAQGFLRVHLVFFINRLRIVQSFLSHCFRAALLAVVLLSCRIANGQQLQPAPWNDPAVVWLAPAQAQIAVRARLDQLEPQLADLIPGSGQHTDTLRHIIFYKSILRSLAGGSTVLAAIEMAIPEAASLGGSSEHAATPEAELRSLWDDALMLLTN